MAYVDGFVMPIKKKNLAAYKKLAKGASRVWIKHGALTYVEALGDDLHPPMGVPFPKLAKLKTGETVVFAFITYKSRAHRDKVNAKVMADPAMNAMVANMKKLPFEMKRMTYGGFKSIVAAGT